MSAWKIPLAMTLVAILACLLVEHAVMEKQVWTIADIKNGHVKSGTVVVRGTIAYSSDNCFILDDGTGKAQLYTCPTWYRRIDLYEGQHVVVVAEVVENPSSTADYDLVLSAYKIFADGDTILIRSRPGKPPWAVREMPLSYRGKFAS